MTFRERLVIAGAALFLTATIVGSKLDDALGHDGTSLAIGVGAAGLICLIGGPILVRWVRKAEK